MQPSSSCCNLDTSGKSFSSLMFFVPLCLPADNTFFHFLKLDFLERVLREYPSAAHNPDRNGDRTALHWACIANASPAIIETIANAHLGACKHQDRTHGRTPLHYLAMQATEPEQIHALMEADMRAAKVKDNSLKTPLDLAQDSSNPFKLDIIPAIQARKLSEGLFAGLKKIRNASPGKYRATSPGKYNKRTPSPGKYNKRNASPGKYAAPDLQAQSNAEGDNQGSADRGRPGRSSRSERRSSRSERASMPIAGASAAAAPMIGDQLRGFMPLLGQPNGMDNDVPSRRVHQYHGSSVDGISHGTDSSEEVVSGEFGAPPRVVQSTSASLYAPRSQFPAHVQSMASYTSPGNFSPPRRTQTASSGYSSSYSNSPIPPAAASRNRSYSPKLTSSRDHSPKSTSSRDQSPMPPRIVRGGNSSQPRSSNSSQPRHSNQSIADGMDESIRELRIQLERKRGVLREKDNEIHQISDQILQAAREEGTMSRQLEQARSSGVDQNALFEKQGKVLRLKQQIDDLKAELRRAEKEVKKMESKSPAGSGNLDFMEQQLHLKKDEQSTLRAVMEALEDEKKSAKREVDNIDSELKSLETIQMLAQGEDIG
jgi:hypothetical protein